MLKQISKRELLRNPQLLDLAHSQNVVVTHRGKPAVVIAPVEKRRGKPAAQHRRDLQEIFGDRRGPKFDGVAFLASLR